MSTKVVFSPLFPEEHTVQECMVCLVQQEHPDWYHHRCSAAGGSDAGACHVSHKECLLEWLSASVNREIPWRCPLCSWEIEWMEGLVVSDFALLTQSVKDKMIAWAVRVGMYPLLGCLSSLLLEASARGDKKMLRAELDRNTYTEKEVDQAFFAVIRQGHEDCLSLFLEDKVRVSGVALSTALLTVARKEQAGCIRELLKVRSHMAYQSWLHKAFNEALAGQEDRCVQEFLLLEDFVPEDSAALLCRVAEKGFVNSLGTLLEHHAQNFVWADCYNAMVYAIRKDQVDCLRVLLSHCPLEEWRGRILCSAIRTESSACLNELLAQDLQLSCE